MLSEETRRIVEGEGDREEWCTTYKMKDRGGRKGIVSRRLSDDIGVT